MGGTINIGSNPGLMGASMGQYAPKACMNLVARADNASVKLTWSDPENYTTTDNYLVEWVNTRIVRKTGGYPVDENDGTVVVTSSTKNQYKTNGYIDSGLTNNVTYYYRAFACSTDGVYNHEQVQATAKPIPYKIMTVKIDLSNSNPATCGSYADNASTMSSGKDVAAWQEFFGYRPCLFKNGKVVGYLNPNDFTKFENGTTADITSGNAGDVMIQFPRRGVRISKSGKVITVSMTDRPNDPNFKYYAHQRGSTNKDYFYLGAYDGSLVGANLRSLSGKTPNTNMTLADYDTYGKTNGTGYGCMGYYQWLFLQVMYLLQFKGNLNSQSTVGYGNSDGYVGNTGRSNTKGMIYGDTSVVKLFGIEDIWGNIYQLINNYYSDNNFHITTTTDDTITDRTKYIDQGSYGSTYETSRGCPTDCMGTTEAGFTGTYGNYNGSTSTYFCDFAAFDSVRVPMVGGNNRSGDSNGLFYFYVYYSYTSSYDTNTGSRLGYL